MDCVKYFPPGWVIEFVKATISEFDIDESHGLDHAYNVMSYAQVICYDYVKAGQTLIQDVSNTSAVEIILISALIHDMCDHKYMDELVGIERIRNVFKERFDDFTVSAIITIISNISYSKRIVRRANGLPMISTGELQLATEIVCDADMLDCYNPERCLIYQTIRNPGNESENRKSAKKLLCERVLKYRDEFINTPSAKSLALPLHNDLVKYIESNLADVVY
jgi:hypothetical protein